MNNSYVNVNDHWPKTLSSTLNVLVNWKRGKRPPDIGMNPERAPT